MGADRQDGTGWVLTSVALVVRGPELDPDALTARLAPLRPTGTRPPGPSRWARPGDVDGEWRLQCDERTARDFATQLDAVLTAAESRRERWRELRDEGLSVAVVVRGYAGHDTRLALGAEELRRVARLGLSLSLAPSTSER